MSALNKINLKIFLPSTLSTLSAPLNMGVDEALLGFSEKENACFFRFYFWQSPCFSFGYFQRPVQGSYKKRPCVRRITGGGIVLHDKDLTFSFSSPLLKPFKNTEAIYSFFSGLVMRSIQPFTGNDLVISKKSKTREKDYNCFDIPVSEDILFQGKKIYGAALRKTRKSFLLQGTLQGKLISAHTENIINQTIKELEKLYDLQIAQNIPDDIMALAGELSRTKYSLDDWNWKK